MSYVMAMAVILIMAALGVLIAGAVTSVSGSGRLDHPRPGRWQQSAAPGPGVLDAAEEELRLRYARGEIGREEFLQRKIDLER
ncbi:SHOCT domain-containing protein [Nocardiopsis sp. NPDC058631]|uniref:SHOCT domain-containing protein n=1 Tax=Nocardiopsis sp. NPDC058631 TaxID=3346566 RepID=UPI003646AABE